MSDLQQHISSLERLVGDQPKSPLFARLASLYIEAGRPKDALRLCDAGLAGFPFYSTGHFIKGKALIALSMKNEARREFEFVRDWLPTNPTIADLLEGLPATEEDLLSEPPASVEIKPVPIVEPARPTAPPPQSTTPMPEDGGMAMFDRAPEAESASTSAPAEESNIFGLSSVAPTEMSDAVQVPEAESPRSAFGSMEGFGASTAEAMPDSNAQVSTTYEELEARMRGEIGEGGTQSLEEFLASGSVTETTAAHAEPMTEFAPAEAPAQEEPFGGFGSAADTEIALPPFGQQTPQEEPQRSPLTDPFAAFAGPPADEAPSTAAPESPEAETSSFQGPDFSGMNFPAESPTTEETSPDSASAEPTGDFSGPSFEGPPPMSDNKIEAFAEKLQDAGKITPVIDFSSKMSSESTGEAAVNAGFVTPTLAEIYAKQGWYDDAINAYKTLARTRPSDKEKFDKRIEELEEEKKKAG